MPLTFNTDNSKNQIEKGTLYIVATPIGNLEDITIRSLRVLEGVDLVAAEDTRTTGKLLSFYSIRTRLTACHEHNEEKKAENLVDKLVSGNSIALVSDAGTPSVSDPGFRLVRSAIKKGIPVVPVPGVSAAVAALSVSGLPTDTFVFCGFLPRKKARKTETLKSLSLEKKTLIFYESPKRIIALIVSIQESMGDREAVLCREMTKLHEEFIRGRLTQICSTVSSRPSVKGECTLIVSGKEDEAAVSLDLLQGEISERLMTGDISPSQLARELADKYALRKKIIYDEIQRLKTS